MSSSPADIELAANGVAVPDSLRLEVLKALNDARFLDAHELALVAGPLEQWTGADARLIGARLARHLGSNDLYVKLTLQAWREKPAIARFQSQRIYATMGQRGIFTAWEMARRLAQATSETTDEEAEAYVCQGCCAVVFRDFTAANGFFAKACELGPQIPWVWTEYSALPAEEGDYEKALEIVNYALALQPFYRPALLRKSNYLQSLRRDDEAFALLEEGRRHLQSAGVVNQLVVMCSEREDWPRMLDLLDESERLSPLAADEDKKWVFARRTDALLGLKRIPEAIPLARKVESKFYDNLAEKLEKDATPGRRVRITVPFIQQEHDTCAPATLSAITSFWGNTISQDTLIGEICYDGTYDFVERRWAERAGWHAREFKMTWDVAVALLDRGVPFILTTQEINSGHSQAVIGYDTTRRSLLIRDPSHRHYAEYGYDDFEEHYAPVGPRGFLLLPPEHAAAVADIELPEAGLYDILHQLNRALDEHDVGAAQERLAQLSSEAPGHRLEWTGRRAIACYNQNPLAHLEAIDGLRALFPKDDRLLYVRLQLLRNLGREHEARELVHKRCHEKDAPALFSREYAQELRQEKGMTGAAIRAARRTLKFMPRDVDTLTALAGIFWNIQDRPEAIALQRLAVCVADKKESAADGYFRMQVACGQSEAGLDFLRQRFSDFIAKSGAPAITLANALDTLDRGEETRSVLDEALQRRPGDGDLLLRQAELEAARGQLDQSRELLDRASRHTRRIPWLRAASHLEQLYGNYEVALQHQQETIELSPLDVGAHRQIAWLLARRDGRAAAREYVRALGEKYPGHHGVLSLEIGWRKTDEPEDMERRVTVYLHDHPSDAWARREYVLLLLDRQATDEALVQAQEARQYEPYNVPSWQIESSVLEAMNRRDEARVYLRRALELSIDSTYAMRRFVFLADTVEEKRDAVQFIDAEFSRQSTSGAGIPVYREVAFPILEIPQMTANLRGLWQMRPDLWESWHTLMHQLVAIGQLDEAREIATGATQRFPTLPVIWRDAARLEQRMGALPNAMERIHHALRINPDWTPAIFDLAEYHRRQSQLKEARELLERSHLRNPLDAPILGTLADLVWHLGEHETAVQQVKQAIGMDPDYEWGWNTLSHWSHLLYKKDLALEIARERAHRLGSDATAWLRVSQLSHRPELAGERLETALRARECEPRNTDAHDDVATAFAAQRRFDEAVTACRPTAFGERVPIFLQGREAWLLAQQNQMPEAITKMKSVVALDPHYFWGWDRLVDWHSSSNHFKDSVDACEKLIRLSPMKPTSYGKRARAYLKLTRNAEAERDFERALALDPSYTYAGWQLFKMQVGAKAFPAATQTLAIMRPNITPGVVLPGEIILACRQERWDEALKKLEMLALLPEVDTNAVNEAFQVLDSSKQREKANKVLTSLISNPGLNAHMASVWADRIDLVAKYKLPFFLKNLFWYLKQIPAESNALEAALQNVILNSKRVDYPVRLIRRIVKQFPKQTRQHTSVWAVVGQIFATHSCWRETADWLKDWESHADAEGWMVTNLVFALQVLGRIPEADAVSTKLLARGLRDHTAAYHLLYLALSALEARETARARELLRAVHLESEHASDKHFLLAVEKALVVQDAEPGPVRRNAAATARGQLAQSATGNVGRVLKAEARAAAVMAHDAGGFGARFYAFRTGFRSRTGLKGSRRRSNPITVWIIVVIVLVNALRACASH